MPAVYVIHKDEDRSFIERAVLPVLAALGFEEWLSAPALEERDDSALFAAAFEIGPATLAVVSRSALTSARFKRQLEQAVASETPCIPIYLGVTAEEAGFPGLAARDAATVASADDGPAVQALWTTLASQLPGPVASGGLAAALSPVAESTGWDAAAFSYLLAAAMGQEDFSRGAALVRAFSHHLGTRAIPYSRAATKTDLDLLRKKKQFLLMRDYAAAVFRVSPDDYRARRQLGQALIELGEFDYAEEVLRGLVRDVPSPSSESVEGRGLLGRVNKQRYVNARDPVGAHPSLLAAIDAYQSVFDEDHQQTWHGVNAASLILRAHRDRVAGPPLDEARRVAEATLAVLDQRQKGIALENLANPDEAVAREGAELVVWDHASRVEALIDLERFDEAAAALEEYLDHPGMDAFEVAATFRQFDEVLQLSNTDEGRPLLERLRKAAERFRTGGLPPAAAAPARRAMLVRVANPDWRPADVPDLETRAHFGDVMSIVGSDATVRALLKEAVVLSIEDSRPVREYECAVSMPFINAIPPYRTLDGHTYAESGDRAMVAIVDDGIDVLHEAFLDDLGQTRIVGIWDQRDGAGPPPAGFLFGTYYSGADIARFLSDKSVPPALGRNTGGHGTHVASIAAGRKTAQFAGGVAPAARLLVVISSSDQPTGYSDAHLAALKFIDQVASARGEPVVVNISQGMNAGAHDGRSALELAFEHFSRLPGRVVVKSAGNERTRNGHAEVSLLAGAAEPLDWQCDPVTFPPSRARFEAWWGSANKYSFQLLAPLPLGQWRQPPPPGAPPREASAVVDRSNPEASGRFKGRGSYDMSFVLRHPDNGDSVLKVEVTNSLAQAAPVFWTLQITAQRVSQPGHIHAWIERDGPPNSKFLNHANEERTLTVPGTAYSVITVGAIAAANPITVGIASSYGPTRDDRSKPEVVAPGINITAACGETAADVTLMSGTSMAAPHVAGAVALVLSKVARANRTVPSATQISAAIRETTKNYSGVHDRGHGYGVLDVDALLAEF